MVGAAVESTGGSELLGDGARDRQKDVRYNV